MSDPREFMTLLKEDAPAACPKVTIHGRKNSEELWERAFGSRSEWRRFPADHWLSTSSWQTDSLDWLSHYNAADYPPIGRKLRALFRHVSEADTVICHPGPGEAIETDWETFTELWSTFVWYADEALYTIPTAGLVFLFTTFGDLKHVPLPA